jgi:hypothetical protein
MQIEVHMLVSAYASGYLPLNTTNYYLAVSRYMKCQGFHYIKHCTEAKQC